MLLVKVILQNALCELLVELGLQGSPVLREYIHGERHLRQRSTGQVTAWTLREMERVTSGMER